MTLRPCSAWILGMLCFLLAGDPASAGPVELREAACSGDLAQATVELDSGTSVTGSAVTCAIQTSGSIPVLELFLKRGWGIDQPLYGDGCTIAHVAATTSHEGMLELAIRYGADLNRSCIAGTPLILALTETSLRPTRVATLLENGASVSLQGPQSIAPVDGRGHVVTPLFALNNRYDHRDSPELTEYLLKKGADPNQANLTNGQTPIFTTQNPFGDYVALIELLIKFGARWDILDKNGRYPFGRFYLDQAVIDVDLAMGADFNRVDAHGENVLFHAICTKETLFLLNLGLATDLVGRKNRGLLHRFLECGDGAAEKSEILKRVIRGGADLSLADQDGITPLMAAFTFAYDHDGIESACLLTDQGADARPLDRQGRAAIHHFARAPSDIGLRGRALDCLETAGADMNAASADGSTPLMEATLSGRTGVLLFWLMESLVERGADPLRKNAQGKTACDLVSDPFALKLLRDAAICP